MIKSKYYKVHEFVPKSFYEEYGEKAWRFVPIAMIETADTLKERFPLGTITINNYFWGGNREWSGIRTPSSPYYSETSMHSFGAIDSVYSHYTAEEVRNDIICNPHLYPHVKGLELGVSWVHTDFRNEIDLILFTA